MSNYEKMKNNIAIRFLQYNQEDMIQKFDLEHDEMYLYIFFVGRIYRINRITGSVSWSNDSFHTEEKADYNETMTIYDVLCYSRENCHLANEWVNVRSLSSIYGGSLAKEGDFLKMLENILTEKPINWLMPVKRFVEEKQIKETLLMSWICFLSFR